MLAEVGDLGKRYGEGPRETVVLDGLDAQFRAGRLTAVTGPSGSGKTTLLHILAGLRDPSAGSVSVLGERLQPASPEERAALRRDPIAFIPQDPGLTPFLSARENVELALALRDLSPDDARQRALDALSEVGLAERAEQRVGRLSAGERQRVAVAGRSPPCGFCRRRAGRAARRGKRSAVGALFGRYAARRRRRLCATHDPLVVAEADGLLAL